MNEYSLTPVQEVDGLRIKRDDLYAPFGPGEVNGGKLRQCVMLVNSILSRKAYGTACPAIAAAITLAPAPL